MKRIDVLQLIASIFMLIGSVINLFDLFMEIPFALHACTLPLLTVALVLFCVVWAKQIRDRKKNKGE